MGCIQINLGLRLKLRIFHTILFLRPPTPPPLQPLPLPRRRLDCWGFIAAYLQLRATHRGTAACCTGRGRRRGFGAATWYGGVPPPGCRPDTAPARGTDAAAGWRRGTVASRPPAAAPTPPPPAGRRCGTVASSPLIPKLLRSIIGINELINTYYRPSK